MKVILSSTEDMFGQVSAAMDAIKYWNGKPIKIGDVVGFRYGDKFYGVKQNKDSITVYPQ